MKKIVTLVIFLSVVCVVAAQQKRTVESPDYKDSNTNVIDVVRVEADENATFVWLDIYGLPNTWARINSTSFLRGCTTGNECKLLSAEGIVVDKEYYFDENGFVSCKLKFEPLSSSDDAFDFSEGNFAGAWHIDGISLLPPDTVGKIKIHIEGTVDNKLVNRLFINKKISFSGKPLAFIPVRDGKFSKDFYADEQRVYILYYRPWGIDEGLSPLYIPAASGSIKIHFDKEKIPTIVSSTCGPEVERQIIMTQLADSFYRPVKIVENKIDSLHKAKLGYTPVIIYDYLEQIEALVKNGEYEKIDSINTLMNKCGAKNNPQLLSLEEERDSLLADWNRKRIMLLREYPSLFGFFMLKGLSQYSKTLDKHDDFELCNKIYRDVYSELYKDSEYHEYFSDSFEVKKGEPYIDYTLRDNDGKEVAVSSLIKNKVAVIHLWASWCGPCRRHGREIVEIYEKYKEKGLVIVGIAREKSQYDFRDAVAEERYPWDNYIELNDEFEIWRKHGIENAAGGIFLIDENGTVLLTDPTAEEIKHLLKEKFGGK